VQQSGRCSRESERQDCDAAKLLKLRPMAHPPPQRKPYEGGRRKALSLRAARADAGVRERSGKLKVN